MCSLLLFHNTSSLLVRADQESDGVTKDILKNLTVVLGIRSPQSAIPVKTKSKV